MPRVRETGKQISVAKKEVGDLDQQYVPSPLTGWAPTKDVVWVGKYKGNPGFRHQIKLLVSNISFKPRIFWQRVTRTYPQHHIKIKPFILDTSSFLPPVAEILSFWKTNSSVFLRCRNTSLSPCHTSFWLPGKEERRRETE